jgi:hypothetical protein
MAAILLRYIIFRAFDVRV